MLSVCYSCVQPVTDQCSLLACFCLLNDCWRVGVCDVVVRPVRCTIQRQNQCHPDCRKILLLWCCTYFQTHWSKIPFLYHCCQLKLQYNCNPSLCVQCTNTKVIKLTSMPNNCNICDSCILTVKMHINMTHTASSLRRPASKCGAAIGDSSTFISRLPSLGRESFGTVISHDTCAITCTANQHQTSDVMEIPTFINIQHIFNKCNILWHGNINLEFYVAHRCKKSTVSLLLTKDTEHMTLQFA